MGAFGENSRGRVIGEDWLLERVAAAAKERQRITLFSASLGAGRRVPKIAFLDGKVSVVWRTDVKARACGLERRLL